MSLTNDMLKNLEKNSGMERQDADLFAGVTPVVSRRFDVFLYGMLAIFVVCFGIELFYFFTRPNTGALVQPVVMKPPTIPLMTRTSVPQKLSPVAEPSPPASSSTTTATIASPAVSQPVMTPHKETLGGLYQQALTLLQQHEEVAAVEKLKEILNRNPEYESARITLATLYLQHDAPDTAIHLLSQGVQLNPQSINVNLLLARTLQSEGHSQEALRVLHNLSAIDADDVVYRELLAGISQSLGDHEKAVGLYQDLLRQDPQNARWLTGLGIALEDDHQTIEALDAFQRANSAPDLSPELQSFVTQQIQLLKGK